MKIEIDDEVRIDTDCECEFKKRYIHDHLELNRVWDAVRSLRTQLWEKRIELGIAESAYNNLASKLTDVEKENKILNDKVEKLEDTIKWAVDVAKSYIMWSKFEGMKFCSEAFRYDVMRRSFGENENK